VKRAKKTPRRDGRRREGARELDRSRRRFLELLAAGSAAALARPVAALAEPAKPPAPPAAAAAPAAPAAKPASRDRASPAEIEKQKRDLAATLKAIRDFELPPGSDPSFVFVALRSRRSGPGRP
jgi:hypothetical protein